MEIAERKAKKEKRKQEKLQAAQSGPVAVQGKPVKAAAAPSEPAKPSKPAPTGPVAFVFPGQGSQAVGMIKVTLQYQALRKNNKKQAFTCQSTFRHTTCGRGGMGLHKILRGVFDGKLSLYEEGIGYSPCQ